MSHKVTRPIFLAFIRIHILHHAGEKPFFGLWMKEELESHGYTISAGTLYPILHNLEQDGILKSYEKVVEGKVRKYYKLTSEGEKILTEVKKKTLELFAEIFAEGEGGAYV
ncbi:MAG: PadR family transcriptional regulator [Halanaerobiales bacterium]